MRVVSWNVNGIRAAMKKDFPASIEAMNADMFCLQETKAQDKQVLEALSGIDGYHIYTNSAVKKGYSGTAILTKMKPLSVRKDIDRKGHDREGRVITLEFEDYFLLTVYTPNSGNELKRLAYRQRWDADFLSYLRGLEKKKPLIACGDFNVAHEEIDLARPRENYNKNAGYMQEEIDGMNNIARAHFIDSFRYMKPDEIKYSWWSLRAGARKRNVGWRIDYVLVSPSLAGRIKNVDILNHVMGSDHCPVLLDLDY
jgi:exodeoxyribonuclease-3